MGTLVTVGRKGSFEMAHRLCNAVSCECNDTIHGHSYKWSVLVKGEVSHETGMVLDYKKLSELMNRIESILDHALWLPCSDEAYSLMHNNKKLLYRLGIIPTAENMLCILMTTILYALPFAGYKNITVILKETENSMAHLSLDDYEINDFLNKNNTTLAMCIMEREQK